MKKMHLSAVLVLLVGCGGSETPSEEETSGGEAHAEEEHHHGQGDGEPHEHRMSDALIAFHDVLAPVFHMDPGVEQAQASCDAAASMGELAASVDAAAVEDIDGEAGTEAVDATAALAGACEGSVDESSAEAILAALHAVHDAFHHSMEAWREHHPE